MGILKAFIGKVQASIMVVLGIISTFFFFRSKSLSKQNKELKKESKALKETLEIKEKVIDVRKNNKPTNIDGNIKRMRQNKL